MKASRWLARHLVLTPLRGPRLGAALEALLGRPL